MIISDLSYLENASEISNIMGGAVNADCVVGTVKDKANIACTTLTGGEARVRADCVAAPDRYSPWLKKPGADQTGSCLFSIRGAILELRSF